ncbi:HD domain-containing phosphohydrolase, partial [Candidatus Oleimmundimicrobium sp.]|uniref:HD domain-containing phosphohydrolase n=1 Tax=Candidatus Oleimmundimicrobium sp. TaxID=3060597 RepID=UPI0027281352
MYYISAFLSLASAIKAFHKIRILSVKILARKEFDMVAATHFAELTVPNVFHEALFSASPLATVLVEKQGCVLWANPAFLDLFGYQHHEVLQKKIAELVGKSPKVKQLVANIFVTTFAEGKSLTYTTFRERKDGTLMNVQLTAIPFKAHGKHYAYGIYHNITEREQPNRTLLRTTRELERTVETAIQALSKVIEEHDPYTARHQREVARFAAMIATEMHLSQETIKTLYVTALLHNIGKISVPAEVLNKPGTLNEAERAIINNHPQKGYEIVRTIEFSGPVAECVLQHHELLDGSGYPQGLRDGEILPIAQLITVADVFSAMISDRPYRPSRGIEAALEELKNG